MVMTKLTHNKILLSILIFVFLVLISAFVIEYKLGHAPCKLCLYERIPYFISIFLILNIFFIKKYEKITLLMLFLVFSCSTILAFYHFGIEQSFFNETLACTTEDLSKTLSKEQILEQLEQSGISCKNISFKMLGLSLATINTILSFVLSVIFFRLFLKYEQN